MKLWWWFQPNISPNLAVWNQGNSIQNYLSGWLVVRFHSSSSSFWQENTKMWISCIVIGSYTLQWNLFASGDKSLVTNHGFLAEFLPTKKWASTKLIFWRHHPPHPNETRLRQGQGLHLLLQPQPLPRKIPGLVNDGVILADSLQTRSTKISKKWRYNIYTPETLVWTL